MKRVLPKLTTLVNLNDSQSLGQDGVSGSKQQNPVEQEHIA